MDVWKYQQFRESMDISSSLEDAIDVLLPEGRHEVDVVARWL